MKKLSQVLIDYEGEKLTDDLFDLKYVGYEDIWDAPLDAKVAGGKPTGYCALGVLACEKKQVTTKKQAEYWKDHYLAIVKAYVKDPKKRNKKLTIPYVDEDGDVEMIQGNLVEVIPTLNDDTKLTIPQIGTVLKGLGY